MFCGEGWKEAEWRECFAVKDGKRLSGMVEALEALEAKNLTKQKQISKKYNKNIKKEQFTNHVIIPLGPLFFFFFTWTNDH